MPTWKTWLRSCLSQLSPQKNTQVPCISSNGPTVKSNRMPTRGWGEMRTNFCLVETWQIRCMGLLTALLVLSEMELNHLIWKFRAFLAYWEMKRTNLESPKSPKPHSKLQLLLRTPNLSQSVLRTLIQARIQLLLMIRPFKFLYLKSVMSQKPASSLKMIKFKTIRFTKMRFQNILGLNLKRELKQPTMGTIQLTMRTSPGCKVKNSVLKAHTRWTQEDINICHKKCHLTM